MGRRHHVRKSLRRDEGVGGTLLQEIIALKSIDVVTTIRWVMTIVPQSFSFGNASVFLVFIFSPIICFPRQSSLLFFFLVFVLQSLRHHRPTRVHRSNVEVSLPARKIKRRFSRRRSPKRIPLVVVINAGVTFQQSILILVPSLHSRNRPLLCQRFFLVLSLLFFQLGPAFHGCLSH